MSYTITNNIMYVRDDTGELVPVSMVASGADQTIQAIKDTATAAESQIDTKVTDANAAIEAKTDEQAARIPEVTALAEDVSGLKDDLVNSGINIKSEYSTVDGKYIDYQGFEYTSKGFARTTEIFVPASSKITVTAKGFLTNVAMIAKVEPSYPYTPLVVSTDNEFRSYTYFNDSGYDINVVVSFDVLASLTVAVTRNVADLIAAEEEKNIARYNSLDERKVNKIEYRDISLDGADEGHYIYKNGSYSASNPFAISPKFYVHKGEVISVKAAGFLTNVAMIAKVEPSYPYTPLVVSTDNEYREYTYTAVEDCECVVSYLQSSSAVIRITKKTDFDAIFSEIFSDIDELRKTPSLEKWKYAWDRVCCIGDSLTSGAYYKPPFDGASIDQNYPRLLGRMLNTEVKNAGISGATPKMWYSNLRATIDFAQYGAFVIWFGTNEGLTDTLDTDVNPYGDYHDFADTNTGWYCRIIAEIKESVPDAAIILCSVFVSDATNTVIQHIAEKYGLSVVDMANLSNAYVPHLHSNAVHFNKAGNIVIADRVCNFMKKFAETNSEFGLIARLN